MLPVSPLPLVRYRTRVNRPLLPVCCMIMLPLLSAVGDSPGLPDPLAGSYGRDVAVAGQPVLARQTPTGLVSRPRYERLPAHPVAAHPRLLCARHWMLHGEWYAGRMLPSISGMQHLMTVIVNRGLATLHICPFVHKGAHAGCRTRGATAICLHAQTHTEIWVSVVPVPFGYLR